MDQTAAPPSGNWGDNQQRLKSIINQGQAERQETVTEQAPAVTSSPETPQPTETAPLQELPPTLETPAPPEQIAPQELVQAPPTTTQVPSPQPVEPVQAAPSIEELQLNGESASVQEIKASKKYSVNDAIRWWGVWWERQMLKLKQKPS